MTIFDDIRRIADELELKIHLASMDARDRWTELKPKLAELEHTVEHAGQQTAEAITKQATKLATALKTLSDEVSDEVRQAPGAPP